ncbi:MAG: DUF4129 domain-containing protein [Lapillicoccus sp.]
MVRPGVRTITVPRGRRNALVGIGAVALVVLTIVASSGPVGFVTSPPPGSGAPPTLPPLPTTTTTATPANPLATGGFDPNSLPSIPGWVIVLLQGLLIVIALLAGLWLVRTAWRHAPRYRSRVHEEQQIVPLPELPEELTRSATARMALLQAGTPRNAIVACWLDLEDAAGAVGLPRLAAETSAEYTTRVLKTWDIAPDALGSLAALYREARFSRHDLTEAHREVAVRRLTVLHEELWRVADELSARRELALAEAAAAEAERGSGTTTSSRSTR